MPTKKRKSVVVMSEKETLVKIPERLLAEVQAVVKAKSKDSTAAVATDVEILKAAAKSARNRCRMLHDEIDAMLHQLYAKLNETARLIQGLSCGTNCYFGRNHCVCGLKDLSNHRNRLRELHGEIIKLTHPPSDRDEDDEDDDDDDEDDDDDNDDDEADEEDPIDLNDASNLEEITEEEAESEDVTVRTDNGRIYRPSPRAPDPTPNSTSREAYYDDQES